MQQSKGLSDIRLLRNISEMDGLGCRRFVREGSWQKGVEQVWAEEKRTHSAATI